MSYSLFCSRCSDEYSFHNLLNKARHSQIIQNILHFLFPGDPEKSNEAADKQNIYKVIKI